MSAAAECSGAYPLAVDLSLAWRAALTQALAVAVVFLVLLATPLPEDFFRDWGWAAGPVAWALCSAASWRILALDGGAAARAALAGGALGGALGALVDHTADLVVGVAVFGLVAAAGGRAARAGYPAAAAEAGSPRR